MSALPPGQTNVADFFSSFTVVHCSSESKFELSREANAWGSIPGALGAGPPTFCVCCGGESTIVTVSSQAGM